MSGNIFSFLEEETTNDREIKSDNELRNKKKKLHKKLEKAEKKPSNDLLIEIKILQIQIQEYEESKKTYIPQKKKKKISTKSSDSEDSDDFLDQEYNKYKEENKKRYQEQDKKQYQEEKVKQDQRRKAEERREELREERREEERREEARREEKWREKKRREKIWKEKNWREKERRELFDNCDIKNIPDDLSQLFDKYDKKKYRELTLKYHPDKSNYHVGYIKALNSIKEKYNPIICSNDETWVK